MEVTEIGWKKEVSTCPTDEDNNPRTDVLSLPYARNEVTRMGEIAWVHEI